MHKKLLHHVLVKCTHVLLGALQQAYLHPAPGSARQFQT